METNTTTGITGSGPAGLMLPHPLSIAGIAPAATGHRTRAETGNTARCSPIPASPGRVHRDGIAHQEPGLRSGRGNHRLDSKNLAGGTAWLHPQTDVLTDPADARARRRRRPVRRQRHPGLPMSPATAPSSLTPMPTVPVTRCAATSWSGADGSRPVRRFEIPEGATAAPQRS